MNQESKEYVRSNMQQYKYWMYYIYDDNDETYNLYAYTNDKVISKTFESQRNMDKFKKVSKTLDKLEVHNLAEDNQCQLLELMPVEFYDSECDEKYVVTYALTTEEKLNFIHISANAQLNLYKNSWTNPLIFKKEIQKALFTIDYYKRFVNIADTLTPNAKHNLAHDIIDNIRQICEDGGFYPSHQEDEYFDSYVDAVYNRLPEFSEDIEVDQLAILIKCIKDTL